MPFAWNSPQKPNRYAVNNTIQAINRYTQSMPLACNSPPEANRYAVVSTMPLARYMGCCGLSVFPSRPIISAMWWRRLASCVMHDYLWACVFLSSYYLFTFSPFHLSFPCTSQSPTARWRLTKRLTPVDGLLRVDYYLEQAHYLAYQTSFPHLFVSCY